MLSHHELFLWETNVKDLRIQRMSEMFTFRFYGQRTSVYALRSYRNSSQCLRKSYRTLRNPQNRCRRSQDPQKFIYTLNGCVQRYLYFHFCNGNNAWNKTDFWYIDLFLFLLQRIFICLNSAIAQLVGFFCSSWMLSAHNVISRKKREITDLFSSASCRNFSKFCQIW